MGTLCSESIWKLVEQRTDDAQPQVVTVSQETLTLGRTDQADIALQSTVVSKQHASIALVNGKPLLQDLTSTNGTFVNDQRIESMELKEGDSVRFANVAFHVCCEAPQAPQSETPTNNANVEMTVPWTAALMNFEELMDPGGVVSHFQPIIRLSDRQRIGFECLARSDLERLQNPRDMFKAASELGQEQELSELMRRTSVRGASGLRGTPGIVFLNVHPSEGFSERLQLSLRDLRRSAPQLNLAIEIREETVADRRTILQFRELLDELDMRLVIDDFCADHARLRELAETPPDYLKFDRSFIQSIDSKSEVKRDIIRALLGNVHRLGIQSVAVGVETAAEAETCSKLGFQHAQGFYFGRPDSIAALVEAAAETMVGTPAESLLGTG